MFINKRNTANVIVRIFIFLSFVHRYNRAKAVNNLEALKTDCLATSILNKRSLADKKRRTTLKFYFERCTADSLVYIASFIGEKPTPTGVVRQFCFKQSNVDPIACGPPLNWKNPLD